MEEVLLLGLKDKQVRSSQALAFPLFFSCAPLLSLAGFPSAGFGPSLSEMEVASN